MPPAHTADEPDDHDVVAPAAGGNATRSKTTKTKSKKKSTPSSNSNNGTSTNLARQDDTTSLSHNPDPETAPKPKPKKEIKRVKSRHGHKDDSSSRDCDPDTSPRKPKSKKSSKPRHRHDDDDDDNSSHREERKIAPNSSASKQKRSTTDKGMASIEPPSRQGGRNLKEHPKLYAEKPLTDEEPTKDSIIMPPSRTQSFIQALPVAIAEPETTRVASVSAYTTEVDPITDSGRLVLTQTPPPTLDNEGQRRPALISVRIRKPTVDTKLGVGFRSIFGELKISSIAATSPLANTPLRPGDRLISLDHHRNTNHWSAVQAVNYIRNADGMICFVVRTKNGDSNVAEAAVYKSSIDEILGVSLKNKNGRLVISKINSDGLLGEMSVLHPGDYVEKINSMNVTQMDASLALDVVRSSLGLIIFRTKINDSTEVSLLNVAMAKISSQRFSGPIVAADELQSLELGSGYLIHQADSEFQNLPRPGFISVKVYKPTVGTKLGVSFMNPDGEQLQVGNILRGGMLANSPLAPGMKIHSICNMRCRSWTKQQTIDHLNSTVGEILFVLQDPLGDFSYAAAMVFKPTARSILGISFKTTGGPLRIGTIHPDGLLSNSVLNADDSVIAINGIPCQHMSPSEAVTVTKRNPDSVVLLTKPHGSNGMVISHLSDTLGGDEYDNARRDIESQNQQQRAKDNSSRICCAVAIGIICIIFIMVMVLRDDGCEFNDDYYC